MDSCELITNFLKTIFDFGECSGSIITEILNLYRTFQRVTATRTFLAHLSPDCLKMFSWAIDIFDAIRSVFYFEPFTEYEKFYIFTYVLPMTILMFITAAGSSYLFFGFIWSYLLFAAFGFGLGYIGIDTKYAIISCIVPVVVVAILAYACFNCNIFKIFKVADLTEERISCCPRNFNLLKVTFSLTQALIILTLILLPVFDKNGNLAIMYGLAVIIIIGISMILEIIITFVMDLLDDDELGGLGNFITLGISLYKLLIIPTTDCFLDVIQNEYEKNWRCIVGYAFFSILLPILLICLLVLGEVPSITDKYKDSNYAYIEVADIIKQVIYAFLASYEVIYGCIGIEVAWLLAIIIAHPYHQKSEYCIQLGNSLVLITSNTITKIADIKGAEFISFELSIGIVAIICIPPVLALYVYFGLDFLNEQEGESDGDLPYYLSIIVRFLSPFAMIFFGINIPLLIKKNEIL